MCGVQTEVVVVVLLCRQLSPFICILSSYRRFAPFVSYRLFPTDIRLSAKPVLLIKLL